MGLPLQPDPQPSSPARRRLLLGLAVLAAVLAVGVVAPARRPPARVLINTTVADQDIVRAIVAAVDGARTRVWAMIYVVRWDDDPGSPVQAVVKALKAAHERGVDVRICLDRDRRYDAPEEEDTKHTDPAREMAALGLLVVLDDLDRRSHAKVVLVDDDLAIVGSHNWTRSALALNREASLLVRDPHAVRALEALFADVPGWEK